VPDADWAKALTPDAATAGAQAPPPETGGAGCRTRGTVYADRSTVYADRSTGYTDSGTVYAELLVSTGLQEQNGVIVIDIAVTVGVHDGNVPVFDPYNHSGFVIVHPNCAANVLRGDLFVRDFHCRLLDQ
jgi:hypothetical protein